MTRLVRAFTTIALLLATVVPTHAVDEEGELALQLQNPVASLISVPFQSNFEWGGGRSSDGFRYTLNFQPVIPIPLGQHWNLISRTILPVIHQEDVVRDVTQTGMGDILQSFFFSPARPTRGGWIVGAGPVALLPTATTRFLGGEKLGFGPTAVVLRQQNGWTYGLLANHLWSVAGTAHTPNVNATFMQPFLSYVTTTHTTFTVQTEAVYNWADSKWTIPITPSVSQVLKIWSQPISLLVGPRIYVEAPRLAPDWGMRFTFTLLFPR